MAGLGVQNRGCGIARIQKADGGKATPVWQRKEGKSESGGLNKKGIASYRRANPGSKLSMAVTAKISKVPKIRIYEVGISYYGRTYEEGKKIGWKDAFRAMWCIFKYNVFS